MMLIKSMPRQRLCLFLTTLFLALFFSLNISAQIQVNLRPINPFHFTPEHSWEMDVISMEEKSFRVKVFAQIFTKNHQLIADLESDVLMINNGMNSFNSLTTQTQRINFSMADYGNLISTIGKFPSGEYIVCIKFQCLTPDCDGAGSEALPLEPNLCRDVKVELPTPLLLATPFDKSEIDEKRPMFTWIPPMPIGGMLELRYVYTLTERREGQSNIDAIRRNRPIIQDQFVERPSLFYPLDIEELEYEKDYVWQVEAWYGNVYIATSEVWEFKLKEEDSIIEIINYSQSFIEIAKQDGSSFYNIAEELKIRYNSRINSEILGCTIKDENGNQIGSVINLNTVVGDNRFSINLKDVNGIKNGKTYSIEFKSNNGKIFKFSIVYYDLKKVEGAEIIRKRKSEIEENDSK